MSSLYARIACDSNNNEDTHARTHTRTHAPYAQLENDTCTVAAHAQCSVWYLDVAAALQEEVDELLQSGSFGLGRQEVYQRLLLARVQMELEQLVHATGCRVACCVLRWW